MSGIVCIQVLTSEIQSLCPQMFLLFSFPSVTENLVSMVSFSLTLGSQMHVPTRGFYVGSEHQTQVLMLAQQGLH